MKVYPLKLRPIFKERIWGGQRLAELFGKELAADVKIGESWELADLPDDKCVIANGELKDQTLEQALNRYPEQMVGDKTFSGAYPLLIKLLDAQDVLSVQVHPDVETCKRMGKGDAKTECWYIIAAEPDALIYKGVKKGVTKEAFEAAIKSGEVADLLCKVPVKAGECHFLPAGTAHAIGAGLIIAEIQMPSDTTYRVFDWNRVDAEGKSRQLHIEEAMESINFDISAEDLPVTNVGRLAECEYFTIDKGHQTDGCQVLIEGKAKTLIFLSGNGKIADAENQGVDFKAGDTIFIPATYKGTMYFEKESEYLIVTI